MSSSNENSDGDESNTINELNSDSEEVIENSCVSEDDSSIKSTKRRILRVISSSSEDEEENERAISPRTRMSITGIRPADLTDSSIEDLVTDDDEEDTSVKESSLMVSTANTSTKNDSATNNSNPHLIYAINSPGPSRYSVFLPKQMNEQLSSTLNNIDAEAEEEEVKIISLKNDPIEISSSDDETVTCQVITTTTTSLEPIKSFQPKINVPMPSSLTAAKRNTVSVNYVSKEFYHRELTKLNAIKSDVENSERVLKQCGKSLPDQGRELKLRIDSLNRDLKIKANYIDTLKIEENDVKIDEKSKQETPKEQAASKIPDWNELSAAVNEIKPKFTGKQGLSTFNTQRSMTVDRLQNLHASLKTCPDENVLADEPPGLKVSLMRHQRHALAWMEWREKQNPRGGILADDMGLGKTLTTISMVLTAKQRKTVADEANHGDSEDEKNKENDEWKSKANRKLYNGGTLVVCPASLIRQWEEEINNRVKRHQLSICVHHGNNRETRGKHLSTYDIVITTYQLVSREHKRQDGIFGVMWQRIILDEAHIVRNHKSQSSEAVCALRATYRWALTGTPIQNKEMDVYALLKFLRCSPFDDLATWKLWIEKHSGGKQRLHTVLQTIMLRRTKVLLQGAGELQCLPE